MNIDDGKNYQNEEHEVCKNPILNPSQDWCLKQALISLEYHG